MIVVPMLNGYFYHEDLENSFSWNDIPFDSLMRGGLWGGGAGGGGVKILCRNILTQP